MSATASLYEILGVPKDASDADIKTAYRKTAKITHPDAGGNSALFRQVEDAWAQLKDPVSRASYDASLKRSAPPQAPPPRPPQEDPSWMAPRPEGVLFTPSPRHYEQHHAPYQARQGPGLGGWLKDVLTQKDRHVFAAVFLLAWVTLLVPSGLVTYFFVSKTAASSSLSLGIIVAWYSVGLALSEIWIRRKRAPRPFSKLEKVLLVGGVALICANVPLIALYKPLIAVVFLALCAYAAWWKVSVSKGLAAS